MKNFKTEYNLITYKNSGKTKIKGFKQNLMSYAA